MSRSVTIKEFASHLKRLPVAIAIALASLGLIAVAFAMTRRPETAQSNNASAENTKSNAPWNLALGNVVVLAPELGLNASAPDEAKIEPARMAAKIEAQLTSLRQFYRSQSESDPALLGRLTLRLTLGNSGQVAAVTVLSAQIKDKEFRKAVAAEAAKWNFDGIAPAGTVIDCPLLFVREGMDIATVVNWEKTLRNPHEEQPPAKAMAEARTKKKK